MLSQYDEYPVHQASRPFAHIPSTDYSWDEGYYFGAFCAEEKAFVLTGMRVNPNSDMIGGYALISIAGRQYTVRFSRCWRQLLDTSIGPLRYRFTEPMKTIQLTLGPNDSELQFDLTWSGTAPPFEEGHHVAESRGRLTTDQSRYTQAGVATGYIIFDGKRYEVAPDRWHASRDHSWGLYSDRRPLGGMTEWLPPRPAPVSPRAFRFWTPFHLGEFTGFFHIHESPSGQQGQLNDVFGSPFEGQIQRGWDEKPVRLVSGRHEFQFQAGTRILKAGAVYLADENSLDWILKFTVAAPPIIMQTMGYTPGSWTDGGMFYTYHGNENLAMEWDDFDFSIQPVDLPPHQPKHAAAAVTNEQISSAFGMGMTNQVHGIEYVVHGELTSPDGARHSGPAHAECFINGRYDPYGFK